MLSLSSSLRWIAAALQLQDSGYNYDRTSQRYRDTRTGQWLSQGQMEALTGAYVEKKRAELQQIGDRYKSGSITLTEWETQMAKGLKDLNIGEYVLGRGGLRRMSQRDYGIIGAKTREQLGYLRGFTEAINDGTVATEKMFDHRINLYANNSISWYERGRNESHRADGFVWEIRRLSPVKNCLNCPGYADRWEPIGGLPGIGVDCQCRGNCRCRFEYSRSAANPDGIGASASAVGGLIKDLLGVG